MVIVAYRAPFRRPTSESASCSTLSTAATATASLAHSNALMPCLTLHLSASSLLDEDKDDDNDNEEVVAVMLPVRISLLRCSVSFCRYIGLTEKMEDILLVTDGIKRAVAKVVARNDGGAATSSYRTGKQCQGARINASNRTT